MTREPGRAPPRHAHNGDVRRLVQGGGAYLNDVRIDSADRNIMKSEIPAGGAILKAGKKNIKRIVAQ